MKKRLYLRCTVDRCLRLVFVAQIASAGMVSGALITSFTTSTVVGRAVTYSNSAPFDLGLLPQTYFLDNGTTWRSGAGSASIGYASITSVDVLSGSVRYALAPTSDPILRFTDFSWGDHSAQGSFGAGGPLTLVAGVGSADAVLSGFLLLEDNTATYYSTFNYFAAPVGTLVPFTATYHLASGGWSATTFNAPFSYTVSGRVSFTPEPSAVVLCVTGLGVLAAFIRSRSSRGVEQND